MSSILEGELADEVAEALGVARIPMAVTVRVTTYGEYDPSTGTGGETTYVDHACQGWPESYGEDTIDGTRIRSSDLKVMVLTPTIGVEPGTSDQVIVAGEVYSIINMTRDASGALYEIQARR